MRRVVSSWLASSACSPRFIPSRRICSSWTGGGHGAAKWLLTDCWGCFGRSCCAAGEEAGGRCTSLQSRCHSNRWRQSASPSVRQPSVRQSHPVSPSVPAVRQSHQSVGPDPSVRPSVPPVRQSVSLPVRRSCLRPLSAWCGACRPCCRHRAPLAREGASRFHLRPVVGFAVRCCSSSRRSTIHTLPDGVLANTTLIQSTWPH